jgi:hypothetical protein
MEVSVSQQGQAKKRHDYVSTDRGVPEPFSLTDNMSLGRSIPERCVPIWATNRTGYKRPRKTHSVIHRSGKDTHCTKSNINGKTI